MSHKYMSLEMRKPYKSGTSKVLALPAVILKKNKFEVGDEVEVLWDGDTDMLVRFKKKQGEVNGKKER